MVDGKLRPFAGRGAEVLTLTLWTILAFVTGALAFLPDGIPYLSFLGERPFGLVLRGLCLAAFVFLLFKKVFEHRLAALLLRWLFILVFLPVILLPVFRCFFTVPFIFCRACPDRCPWGILRVSILSSAVLLNLPPGRMWCAHLCPLGTFQTAQAKVSPWRVKFARFAAASGYVFLLTVTVLYLLSLAGARWVRPFEIGWYEWGTAAVAVTAAILLGAFFIPRFFCRYVCPVGAVAELAETCFRPRKK